MAVEKACKAEEAAGQCSTASPIGHQQNFVTTPRSMTGTSQQTDRSRTSSSGLGSERRSLRYQIRYWGRQFADFWQRWKRHSQDDGMNLNTPTGDYRTSESEPNTTRGGIRESISWPQGVNRKTLMSKDASTQSVAVCPQGANDWPYIDDE